MTPPRNFYPNLPVVPYFNGTLQQADVIAYLKSTPYSVQVQAGALALINNESANLKDVINGTNAAGIQSDSGTWPAKYTPFFIATTNMMDSTNSFRGFIVFDTWQHCCDMVLSEVQGRGMYIGGTAPNWGVPNVATAEDVAVVYERCWNTGNATYNAPQEELNGFATLCTKALQAITGSQAAEPAITPPAPTTATVYKLGSTGDIVTAIQAKLIPKYLKIPAPTGYYGDLTTSAVRKYQAAKGLQIDGECGAQTLGALGI